MEKASKFALTLASAISWSKFSGFWCFLLSASV